MLILSFRLFLWPLLLLMLLIGQPCQAQPLALEGQWFEAPPTWDYAGQATLIGAGLTAVSQPNKTGGHFFYQADFEVGQEETRVLDFKNSSVIGRFHHWVFDSMGHRVDEAEGGIQSEASNPFFLRHGRELKLPMGHYRLITEVSSPFLLAQPVPYLDTLEHYRQAIKPGNALTLLCVGLLLGLAFYYAVLAMIRRNVTDALYALFILGNLLYNGTALLVYPELLGLHWFYFISLPILFSNCAYVLFVFRLLEISSATHSRLHRAGMALLGLFAAFFLLALLKPNWSLELDRTGVALFMSYGLVAGIVRARQGHAIAKMYLAAVITFFVLGALSISLSGLEGVYAFYVEHLGLLAVAVEALLLALVLAIQFAQLSSEVAERKRAEAKIAKSLSLLHATLESTNDAILAVDLSNIWVLHNQRFIDLWRIPDEIIAANDDEAALAYVLDQLEDGEGFLNKVRELYAAPEANSFDIIQFKDGRIIERSSIPQRIDGKVAGRVWSFRDITERKMAEIELRQAKEVAEQALAEQRQFTAMISHEYRSPLAVIDSAAQLLGIKLSGEADKLPIIAHIRRAVSRLINFLDNCLTDDRIDSDGLAMHSSFIDLDALAVSVKESAQLIYDSHQIIVELDPDLPLFNFDPQLLRIMLLNLLGNAIKYSPSASEIRLRIRHTEQACSFEVIDRGRGIPADELPFIFKKYVRGRAVTSIPGAGLGLSLVSRIVALHGGSVEIESREGEGTRVIVTIPLTGAPAVNG